MRVRPLPRSDNADRRASDHRGNDVSRQLRSHARHEPPARPHLVVQIIVVQWTKRARGEPLATSRNSVPERLVLPTTMTRHQDGESAVVQTVTFDESNAFAAPTHDTVRLVDALSAPLDGCIQLVRDDDTLAAKLVNYAPYVPAFPPEAFREHPSRPRPAAPTVALEPTIITDYSHMGAPGRSVPLVPLRLRRGEWGQLRYLGRHTIIWSGYHMYKKYTYNIGWVWEVSPRIFIDTQPHHRYDSMPNVW